MANGDSLNADKHGRWLLITFLLVNLGILVAIGLLLLVSVSGSGLELKLSDYANIAQIGVFVAAVGALVVAAL